MAKIELSYMESARTLETGDQSKPHQTEQHFNGLSRLIILCLDFTQGIEYKWLNN